MFRNLFDFDREICNRRKLYDIFKGRRGGGWKEFDPHHVKKGFCEQTSYRN